MRVHLRPGVEPARAIAELKELVGGRALAVRTTSRRDPIEQRQDYVRWATDLEVRLGSVLLTREAQAFFDSPRHRDICSMPPGSQLTTLIYAEVDAITREMQAAVEYLERHLRRMRAAPGLPVVLDTNVLLQCQRLDYLKWSDEIGTEARVMIPLRVIEEIDAKKYGDSQRLRSLARGLLPWIDGLFPNGETGPVRLREDATIELLLADRPRSRPSDADEEILDVAHDVRSFAGTAKVMTGDTGMRVRASSEGLQVLAIPDAWRRPADKPT